MPGVIGCIDGTLIAIVAPRNHPSEAAFFCRKGYHAINAAIVSVHYFINSITPVFHAGWAELPFTDDACD